MNIALRTMAVVLASPLLTFLTTIPFPFSHSHPDYEYYKGQIAQLSKTKQLDLSELNAGKWKIACLFGGYTIPSITMRKYGVVSKLDRFYQPLKDWPLMRFGEIEEHETMIAYVDQDDLVYFVHFGVAPDQFSYRHFTQEHVERCVSRENAIINLADI